MHGLQITDQVISSQRSSWIWVSIRTKSEGAYHWIPKQIMYSRSTTNMDNQIMLRYSLTFHSTQIDLPLQRGSLHKRGMSRLQYCCAVKLVMMSFYHILDWLAQSIVHLYESRFKWIYIARSSDGVWKYHNVETVLLKVLSDTLLYMDTQKFTLFLTLDLAWLLTQIVLPLFLKFLRIR